MDLAARLDSIEINSVEISEKSQKNKGKSGRQN